MNFLTKLFNNATGRTQRKKADRNIAAANEAYGRAKLYTDRYNNILVPKIKGLADYFKNLESERKRIESDITSHQKNAEQLEKAIHHRENSLEKQREEIRNKSKEYEPDLKKHREDVENFQKTNTDIQKLMDIFQEGQKELTQKIGEYNALPNDFNNQSSILKEQKRKLEGYREEENPEDFKNYKNDFQQLTKKHLFLNETLGNKRKELEEKHQKSTQDLEKLDRYKSSAEQLNKNAGVLEQRHNELQEIIRNYNREKELQEADSDKIRKIQENYINSQKQYEHYKSNLQAGVNQRDYYDRTTQKYQEDIERAIQEGKRHESWASRHAKKAANVGMLNLIGGTLLGGLVGFGGNGLIGGLTGATLGGLGGQIANKITGLNKKFPTINVANTDINQDRFKDLERIIQGFDGKNNLGKNAPISSGMLGNVPKINIPELGGLQSPTHFGIPQLPNAHELPTLESVLGRLTDVKELNKLTLGLPVTTGKSGKKYNAGVLLNPDFINSFKRTLRKAGSNRVRYA